MTSAKMFVTLGGFTGFLIAFLSGLTAGSDLSLVLRDASVGCVVGALLMRLLFTVLQSNYRECQLRAQEAEASEEKPEKETSRSTTLSRPT